MTLTDSIRDVLFIYGLAIVVSMGAAVMIRLMVSMLSLGDVWAEWREKARFKSTETSVVAEEQGIPSHHLAAIAAAAYAMGASRVVHIQPAAAQAQWSAGGRAAHHSSHQMIHHH